MTRGFRPKVITANHLLEGDAIYLDANGNWARHLSEAKLFTVQAEAEAALLNAEDQVDTVVGAYLADAIAGKDGPEPVHFREAFRAKGPSNYNHGKQVELGNV